MHIPNSARLDNSLQHSNRPQKYQQSMLYQVSMNMRSSSQPQLLGYSHTQYQNASLGHISAKRMGEQPVLCNEPFMPFKPKEGWKKEGTVLYQMIKVLK
jgi:hypothetical protein